ncbi:hypothetical protein [Maridesulfovibrio salexigens]|uniref:Uncharacterized protein n=1 Tax=Maridesulfovibrio salexigens (strain ATCC 14822 / DSM 2638 / NCIMB 8403 / VKM B-1763) TaxID=526222 RepID=C6C128_MARSD|nr:hypothetical protein [Maridesulfovibrio salexigens]ACS79191.1 hypothetical protein Desal_1128 [Maridesulfovibrio salexigens DSM 2638]
MRVLKIVVMTCIVSMMLCSAAIAGSGKAIVPFWLAVQDQYGGNEVTTINISNISKSDLIVKVTVYNKDSSIKTDYVTLDNFMNSNTEIGAGKSAIVRIEAMGQGYSHEYGYAVIEWENKNLEDDIVGLIAQGGVNSSQAIIINNGLPF